MFDLKNLLENQRTSFMATFDKLKTSQAQVEKALAKSESELKQQTLKLLQANEQLKFLEIDKKILREENQEFLRNSHEYEKDLAALNKKSI